MPYITPRLLMTVAIVGTSVFHASAASPSATKEATDQALMAVMNTPDKPAAGLAVIAIKNRQIVYEGYFGSRYQDPKKAGADLPINADSKFRIASISKYIATIGILQQVEAGKLDIDKDVSAYLGFTLRNPNYPGDVITCRQLLAHTSSIRDGDDENYSAPLGDSLKDFFVPEGKFYEKGGHWAAPGKDASAPDLAPGKFFEYTNLNWGVLGTVLERVTHERFDYYMLNHVFKPMGVKASFNLRDFWDVWPGEYKNIGTTYRKRDDNDKWDAAGPWYPQGSQVSDQRPSDDSIKGYEIGTNGTLFSPQGGVRISVRDLAQFALMMINNGVAPNGQRILSAKSVALMHTPVWTFQDTPRNGNPYSPACMFSWGLGTQLLVNAKDKDHPSTVTYGDRLVDDPKTPTMAGHAGEAYGMLSDMWYDRKQKTGVVYFITGTGADPDKTAACWSGFYWWEGEIQKVLWNNYLKSAY